MGWSTWRKQAVNVEGLCNSSFFLLFLFFLLSPFLLPRFFFLSLYFYPKIMGRGEGGLGRPQRLLSPAEVHFLLTWRTKKVRIHLASFQKVAKLAYSSRKPTYVTYCSHQVPYDFVPLFICSYTHLSCRFSEFAPGWGDRMTGWRLQGWTVNVESMYNSSNVN